MQFRADEYYQASRERIGQAHRISQDGENFALAMYCGGLAVECLLRAFRWSEDASFEGRHDLIELFKASGLLRIDAEYMRHQAATEIKLLESGERLRDAVNEVILRWHNNLRFASESSLKAYLTRTDLQRGTKGDARKANARVLLDSAQILIDRGGVLWKYKKRLPKR